jgi:predicted RNA binding protein YcfA (HicA-like mRNA interferase family)
MSQFEKALERLRSGRSEADFADVRTVLEGFGFALSRQRGSHVVFKRPGMPSVTIPLRTKRRIARIYVELVLRAIESLE